MELAVPERKMQKSFNDLACQVCLVRISCLNARAKVKSSMTRFIQAKTCMRIMRSLRLMLLPRTHKLSLIP